VVYVQFATSRTESDRRVRIDLCLHHVAMHAPVHNRLPTLPSKFNSHGVCYIHINQLKTICNLLLVFVLVSPTRYTQSRLVDGDELSLFKFGVKLSSGMASIDQSLRFTQICFTSPTLLRAASIRALPASLFCLVSKGLSVLTLFEHGRIWMHP